VTSNERDSWISAIDATLSEWSQGDCTIGDDCWFVTRFDPQRPLTFDAQNIATAEAEAGLVKSSVRGFVVVTQTCDLVRSCAKRPFLEISPLVQVDAKLLEEIRRLKRPGYAYITGVADRFLVADLDRVMTVEKAVIAAWEKIKGCQSDADTRSLAEALARKRSRFAFPRDFNEFVEALQKQMQKRHDKPEDDGVGLRALREIRVRAAPAWDAERVELMFWFIRAEEDVLFKNKAWHELLAEWLELLLPSARFSAVEGTVVSLDDMTAKDYLESDRLDLDRLSSH
jgi:hypothetical protein